MLKHNKDGKVSPFRPLVQHCGYQALFYVVNRGDQRLHSTVYRIVCLELAPLCIREAPFVTECLKDSFF